MESAENRAHTRCAPTRCAGKVEGSTILELGDITADKFRGRTHADQITGCDLTGTGVQDTAIARLAFQKARQAGLGTQFET